jgi:hypothetical protein
MFKSLASTFEGKDAPNPHDVAEAIVKLVAQSKGSRAARTVVGAAFGTDKANEDVAPVQAKVVEAPSASAISRKSPDERFRASGLADPASLSMPLNPARAT